MDSKPAWLTEELSQEWVNLSTSEQGQRSSKHSSLRVNSQSRIPVMKKYPSASSFSSLLLKQNLSNSNSVDQPLNNQSHSSSTKPTSDHSIILNSQQQSSDESTPPWLRAAVDGMTNELLGKRPTQLQKIFQTSQPIPTTSTSTDHPIQASSDPNHPKTKPTPEGIEPPEIHASIDRVSNDSIRSLSIDRSTSLLSNVPFGLSLSRSSSSSHYEDLPSNPSYQSIVDHQKEQELAQEEQEYEDELEPPDDQPLLLIPPGSNHERLRFTRDDRLDQIIEETEPSSSIKTDWKNTHLQASVANSRSLPSSSRPPSLAFAHQTPVLDVNNRLHRVNSEFSHEQKSHNHSGKRPSDLPENQSVDNSDSSAAPRRFRFTYDTFTRKHLNKLAEEIKGLSTNSDHLGKADTPLKIKSILGSPGEEVTDSSTSIGLAHSTPPAIVFSSGTSKQRTFHAGRTPYRSLASHSQRYKEEKEWAESFVEPSPYAVNSLSPAVGRKSYQGPRTSHRQCETSEGLDDSVNSVGPNAQQSCRSSKRIRLGSAQSGFETRHRHLRDSVAMVSERKSQRCPAAFTRAHPMVVFKSSAPASTASGTPHAKNHAVPMVVRARLAEAKALMDRIRAKTNGDQEAEATDPPTNFHQKSSGEQVGGSSKETKRPYLNTQAQQSESLESSSALADDRDQQTETRDYFQTSERQTSPPPARHKHHDEVHNADLDPEQHYHQVHHCSRNGSEADLDWDISIEEVVRDDRQTGKAAEGKEGEREEHQKQEGTADQNLEDCGESSHPLNQLKPNGPSDPVHRRLATTAAAFLRQTLGDCHSNHLTGSDKSNQGYGGSSALISSNLAVTAGSRRQFAIQPVSRDPIGRVTLDARDQFTRSNRISSISSAACTTTSAPTPALTTGTTTRHSSSSSHSPRQGFEGDPKHPHHQKLGLMTIAPGDVEQLLQNARVGKMVFDSTIGKWVKVRSQSETGGLLYGRPVEEEQQNLKDLDQFGSEDEESSEEDDIFKDIESLNSKRGSDSSGSRLVAGEIVDATQTSETPGWKDIVEDERNEVMKNGVEANQAIASNSSSNKKKGLAGRSEKVKPKSVLKIANEGSPNKTNVSLTSSSAEDSNTVTRALRPSRSVSFQDGRKNGKIIGLAEGNEGQSEDSEERISKNEHQRPRQEGVKQDPLRRGNKAHQREEKENKQNPAGSSDSENEDGNPSIHQTSKILMNSIKKKVRRKSSLTSSATASQSNSSTMTTPRVLPSRQKGSSSNHLSMTTTTSNSNNLVDDYSFELNYSKLIKIITDFEPFEPFWNSIKVINLAGKSIDSVIRLNEILPALDQIDLSSNQLNYLSGLPSSLRMLIAHKNQINELCCFSHLQNLEKLDLSQNSLTSLEQLSCLKHLRELKVDDNFIEEVSGLYSVDSLIKLSLKGNRIKKINFESTHWEHLEILNLDRNQISEVTGLHHLRSTFLLNLDRNQLYSLTIEEPMPKLRVLRVNENRLESLEVSKLVNLRTLYIDNNDLMEISGAGGLRKLENLSVRDQRGGELSLTLKQVRDVKRIYLGGNPLPAAFPTCQFYNLLYLELAMCQCQSLPADLANLIPNIRTLNLNYNFLKDLSPLKNLRRLERLTIVGSRVKTLDRGLLKVLESLPELELLDLRQNPLCASFYPPLLLSSSPSSAVASGSTERDGDTVPHLNQYQIVNKHHKDDWHSMDDRFRKSLPNEFYLKRMTYRSIILQTCCNPQQQPHPKLKWLDGIKITEVERKKLQKFLRGISRKLDPNREHHQSLVDDSGRSVDLVRTSESSRHLNKNNHDSNPPKLHSRKKNLPHQLPTSHHRQHDDQSSTTTPSLDRVRAHHHHLGSTTTHEESNSIGLVDRSRY